VQTVFIGPAPRLALSVAGRGALLLFLHGIGGRRQNWQAQLAFFSRGFEAAAWDARGYGDSEDYDGPLDFGVFSSDLARVLDCFGAQAAHLVGLSMGGRIACDFALRCPDRVLSLTLANTGPGFGAMTPGQAASLLEQRSTRAPELQAHRMLGPNAPAAAHANVLAGLRALRPDSYRKALEAALGQELPAAMARIAAPTLVIGSRHDPVYPPGIAHEIAERIPGARLVMLEDAGHVSNLEQPERFNQALAQFLDGLNPPANVRILH
jgi:3-oxoadipate enol-lactonase